MKSSSSPCSPQSPASASLQPPPHRSTTPFRKTPQSSSRAPIWTWCRTIAPLATPPTTSGRSRAARSSRTILAGRSDQDDQGLRRADRRIGCRQDRRLSRGDLLNAGALARLWRRASPTTVRAWPARNGPARRPMLRGNCTCPLRRQHVRAYKAWLTVSGITSGPAFRAIDRHGNMSDQALTDKAVARIVKRSILAAEMLNGAIQQRHGSPATRCDSGLATSASANEKAA